MQEGIRENKMGVMPVEPAAFNHVAADYGVHAGAGAL